MITRRPLLLATVALFLPVTLLASGPALAAQAPHSYSIGIYNDTSITGLYGTWHDNNMYMSSADYNNSAFVDNEMWVITTNSPLAWVETGLINGVRPGNPCNCLAYQVFWAEGQNGGNTFTTHWEANLSPDGVNHSYTLANVTGTTQWGAYWNGLQYGTSTYQTTATGQAAEVGAEIADGYQFDNDEAYNSYTDADEHQDTLSNFILVQNNHQGYYSPQISYGYITNGCSTTPIGYCMNGTDSYAPNEWANNKP